MAHCTQQTVRMGAHRYASHSLVHRDWWLRDRGGHRGLFATSSRDYNEGTAVQGVIKSHCPITDNTSITSHHGDVLHNMRLAVLDTWFVSGKNRTHHNKQL